MELGKCAMEARIKFKSMSHVACVWNGDLIRFQSVIPGVNDQAMWHKCTVGTAEKRYQHNEADVPCTCMWVFCLVIVWRSARFSLVSTWASVARTWFLTREFLFCHVDVLHNGILSLATAHITVWYFCFRGLHTALVFTSELAFAMLLCEVAHH